MRALIIKSSIIFALIMGGILIPEGSQAEVLQASKSISLINFTFFGNYNGWAISQKGAAFISSNGGHQWKQVTPVLSLRYVTNFYDFLSKNFAWRLDEKKNGEIIVSKTSDRVHWANVGKLFPKYQFGGIQVDFVDNLHGFIENTLPGMGPLSAVLYYTNDGGAKWKEINSTSRIHKLLHDMPFGGNILFRTKTDGWLYGSSRPGGKGGLYHTTDGGLSWFRIAFPGSEKHLNALQFFPTQIEMFPSRGLAVPLYYQRINSQVEIPKLFVSKNNGITWTKTNLAESDITSISFIHGGWGWMTTMDGKLYDTENDGRTWSRINSNIKWNSSSSSSVQFVSTKNGFMVVNETLYKTKNGGHTWLKVYG